MLVENFFGTWIVVSLIANALLALIPAYIAETKGRSYAGFWALSFFATIFVGLIAVLAIPALSNEEKLHNKLQNQNGIPDLLKCPYCAELIRSEAKICKHCGKSVEKAFVKLIDDFNKKLEDQEAQKAAAKREYLDYQQRLAENDAAERLNRKKARKEFFISNIGKFLISVGIASVLLPMAYLLIVKPALDKQYEIQKDKFISETTGVLEKAFTVCEYRDSEYLISTSREWSDAAQLVTNIRSRVAIFTSQSDPRLGCLLNSLVAATLVDEIQRKELFEKLDSAGSQLSTANTKKTEISVAFNDVILKWNVSLWVK